MAPFPHLPPLGTKSITLDLSPQFVPMLSSVFVLLAPVAPAMARPYLEFCSLVDYTQNGRDGISIDALCGDTNAPRCQTLDIDSCFANSGGLLVPAQNRYASIYPFLSL